MTQQFTLTCDLNDNGAKHLELWASNLMRWCIDKNITRVHLSAKLNDVEMPVAERYVGSLSRGQVADPLFQHWINHVLKRYDSRDVQVIVKENAKKDKIKNYLQMHIFDQPRQVKFDDTDFE